ncbi:hypothetical protein Bca4012_065410 [Brassica carinata]
MWPVRHVNGPTKGLPVVRRSGLRSREEKRRWMSVLELLFQHHVKHWLMRFQHQVEHLLLLALQLDVEQLQGVLASVKMQKELNFQDLVFSFSLR